MKDFKDMTAAEFIDGGSVNSSNQKKVHHCGLFRVVNKDAFRNEHITISEITPELLNVPRVTISR